MRGTRWGLELRAGEPGKGVVRIGQMIGILTCAVALTQCWGCAHGPRRFRKIQSETPLVRARAVGLAARAKDTQVVPTLVGRLGDADPVVRLAAHEELRKRTGQDFGYLPWGTADERSRAIDRWRAWLGQGRRLESGAAVAPALPGKTLPVAGP